MNTKPITGIVLAGGRSRRMGRDKSTLEFNGKSLVEYAIDALKPLCGKVVISSNNFVYDYTGCEVWPDELPGQAPMIGIYSCLKRSTTEYNMVLSCDMPMISTAVLQYLLENIQDKDVAVPLHKDGFIEPLCGIYKKSATGILKDFIDKNNFRLNECIRAASHQLVLFDSNQSFYSPTLFTNINTPEDFNRLKY
jgi:molybdenum cofactor guanylyltransferase